MKIFGIYIILISLLAGCNGSEKLPYCQYRNGLPQFFHKIGSGENATVVFMGGSITSTKDGYAYQIGAWLSDSLTNGKATVVNAGIGATGSDFGAFRTDKDILTYNPDLVFIEFAVNDAAKDSAQILKSMEGIVRKIINHNNGTNICFLYTISEKMLDDLNKGITFRSVKYMEQVADYYGIPSINLQTGVLELLHAGKLVFKGDKKLDYKEKILFSGDGTHPQINTGHAIYAGAIKKALLSLQKFEGKVPSKILQPLNQDNMEDAKLYDLDKVSKFGKWHLASKNDLFGDLSGAFKGKIGEVWQNGADDDSIVFNFNGVQFGFNDVLGPSTGLIEICTDGKTPIQVRRFDKNCYYHRPGYFLSEIMEDGSHRVIVRPKTFDFDKIAMVLEATDYAHIGDLAKYKGNSFYPSMLLIRGEVEVK